MATFAVVIDACVLFNAPVRDTLLRAAESGLFRLHWSQKILDETTKNLVLEKKMDEGKALNLVSAMSKAFPEALLAVPQEQIDAMKNQEKDRHVAACAVCAGAQVIATFNLRDFKPETLSEWNIEAQHPDELLCHLFGLFPGELVRILVSQAEDLRDMTLDKLLVTLEKHVPKFANAARKRLSEKTQ